MGWQPGVQEGRGVGLTHALNMARLQSTMLSHACEPTAWRWKSAGAGRWDCSEHSLVQKRLLFRITKHVTHLNQERKRRKHKARQSLMLQEAHQGSDHEAHEDHL